MAHSEGDERASIPERFRTRTLQAHGPAAAPWLDELPGLVQHFTVRWGLAISGAPLGANFNLVFPVDRSGQPAVLKLSFPGRDFRSERAALAAYTTTGVAAALLDSDDRGAMLIERILPGEPLGDRDPAASATIAARLALRLHAAVVPPDLPTYASLYAEAIAKAEGYRHREDFPWEWWSATMPTPAEIDSGGPPVLLHEDLHHANILRDAGAGWRVIDPHGLAGPAVHDCAQFLFNPHASMVADPATAILVRPRAEAIAVTRQRIQVFGDVLGLAPDAIVRAALAKLALNAAWCLIDGDDWAAVLQLREMIDAAG